MNKASRQQCTHGLPASGLLLLITCWLTACSPHSVDESFVVTYPEGREFVYEVFSSDGTNKKPLVLLSHGSGGDYRNYAWLTEGLVAAGYIVATLNHPFNNAMDNTSEGVARVWDRPRDLSLLLDSLEENPHWSQRIDFNRVGVAGHSSGGYTAIALGGALYKPGGMEAYCNGSNRGPDCDLVAADTIIDYTGASTSYRDTRIKSIVAMAPAVGPSIEQGSLESIDVPVYIITTQDDEILTPEHHASYYARHIPTSELALLPEGGHFIYIECDVITRVADWFIKDLDLCGSQLNVDQAALRHDILSRVLAFFGSNIG